MGSYIVEIKIVPFSLKKKILLSWVERGLVKESCFYSSVQIPAPT